MRRIAQELGVVPMALYKHVADKGELLVGMIDVVVGEIDPPIEGADWKTTMRERILSARRALLRHPWASRVLESRGEPTPTVIAYMDSMMGILLAGGFSIDLMHHAMHVMGSESTSRRSCSTTREHARGRGGCGRDGRRLRISRGSSQAMGTHGGAVSACGCDTSSSSSSLDLILDGLERSARRNARGRRRA
jgi:AcrR family transcriptional regulator